MKHRCIREFIRDVIKEKLDPAQIISQYAHQGQRRRSGEPYFLHPQEVANIIVKYYPSDTIAYYVAMLHDALEDGIPLGNLADEEEFFNILMHEIPDMDTQLIDTIYNSTVALTKTAGSDYIDYVINLSSDKHAFRVKLADMMQNIGDNPSERQVIKYSNAKDALIQQFGDNGPIEISPKHWHDFKKIISQTQY